MSKTPNYDAKIKTLINNTSPNEKICPLTGEKWQMTEKEIALFKDFNVPPLKSSPETFIKKILPLFTAYSWWWNKHAETGKPLLTYIHPHTQFKIISDEEWHTKDFSTINQELFPEHSFFNQLFNLATKVPLSTYKNVERPVNSIARISLGDEDSYFVEGTKSKRCFYCTDSFNIEDSSEVCWSSQVNNSYDVLRSHNISNCRVVRESRACLNCFFIFDCRNCQDCFMSWNQRNKKYLWNNEQLTAEEWHRQIKKIDFGDFDIFDKYYLEFFSKINSEIVWPENFNDKCQNSTGEYLQNSLNCERGWYCDGAKNSYYGLWDNFGSENNALGIHPGSSHCYGNAAAFNCQNCLFNYFAIRCQNCEYCIECYDCENCFGCVGLKRKKFCILNKQYSEDEYWKILDNLKCAMLDRGEYGEPTPLKFILTPLSSSSFGLGFAQAEKQMAGLDFEPSLNGAYGDWSEKTFYNSNDLPKKIDNVEEEWIGRALISTDYQRPFTILKPELAFYKKMRLPVRREHFIKRIEEMWKTLNKFEQEEKICLRCQKNMTVAKNTAYPNRKIFCHGCYLKYLENR
ncbi:MAG: hypothetical protein V1664_04765 [Candidatus Uhrbacteria bacterium]